MDSRRDTIQNVLDGYGSDSSNDTDSTTSHHSDEDKSTENPFDVAGIVAPPFVRRPKRDGSLVNPALAAQRTLPPLLIPVIAQSTTPTTSLSPANSVSSIASSTPSTRVLVPKKQISPPPRYQSRFRASPPAPILTTTNKAAPSANLAGPLPSPVSSVRSTPMHSRTTSLLQHEQSSASTSRTYGSKTGHLRQRSAGGSAPASSRWPASPVIPPSPTMSIGYSSPSSSPNLGFTAAFMSESNSGHSEEGGYEEATARGMRGDRAEWLPTQQHLYSASSLAHDDVVLRSGPNSASSHGSSQRKYNAGLLDPKILQDYEKGRYTSEADDRLHDVGNEKLRREGRDRRIMESDTFRGTRGGISPSGCLNLFALTLLGLGIVMVFGGYPIITYYQTNPLANYGAVGIGGTNASGQVPDIPAYRGLIDKDTPSDVLTRTGFDGKTYQLQFSDEFNTPGRSFEPGMDPYFTAVNLHYWQTNNLEWYDPGNIVTEDGYLSITLSKEALADSHGLGYLGGLLSSWNQFCFTGGYIEVAVSLPGDTKIPGLWPAAWTMSNLGRAGYGGSLDGTWPYTYNTCDIGTLANQTNPATGGPLPALLEGDPYHNDTLSYLAGQKLSACTCPGESHPGPQLANGSWAGRGATEIDIFEATVDATMEIGQVSQSGQWAPFNPHYEYVNTSTKYVEFWESQYNSTPNTYMGGVYQQVTSGLSETDPTSYNSTTNFKKYGFEWKPSYFDGWGTGSILWTQDDLPMWKLNDLAMEANTASQVGNREVPGEPHYIILNLGMSENFGEIDFQHLVFPAVMRVDYVRVYQDQDYITDDSLSCDPKLYPTANYIAKYPDAYNNPNITLWSDMGLTYPKNSLLETC